jgi:enterochelin esterase-like enzyme
MHDGEMLYDASITWNKQTWNVDSIVSVLLDKGMIDEFIIAGVHNAGSERHSEYFPQKVFESLTNQDRDSVVAQLRVAGRSNGDFSPYSDQYVSFLADQLLPFLRKAYPLKRGSVSVGLAGSSMGGLISIYGMCERPKDFGFALCLSTHWLGSFQEDNPFPRAMLTYLEENIPSPRRHKVYMDHGDKTLDSYYGSWQLKVNDLFSKKKWGPIQFRTLVFLGKDHSEKSWSERFHLPLLFVFGTN